MTRKLPVAVLRKLEPAHQALSAEDPTILHSQLRGALARLAIDRTLSNKERSAAFQDICARMGLKIGLLIKIGQVTVALECFKTYQKTLHARIKTLESETPDAKPIDPKLVTKIVAGLGNSLSSPAMLFEVAQNVLLMEEPYQEAFIKGFKRLSPRIQQFVCSKAGDMAERPVHDLLNGRIIADTRITPSR